MQTPIISIGNSKGLRLPKAILQQCGIKDMVDLRVTDGGLMISPVTRPRAGWEKAIQLDPLDDGEFADMQTPGNVFDAAEWAWPEN
jgi:antitoxin MazE